MPPPFDGLRVLDLTTGIAGGYATKLLVDGGADALLVEPPGGDPLRRFTAATAPLAPGEDAPLFRFLRAGVASVDADGERLTALAAEADVVLATYRPGQGHGGRMDARRLTATFPSLVVVSISPWGTTGPWADRPATELTVQAACGGTARRGLPDRSPVSAGGELGEWLVGVFAAVGAVTGWRHARRTGRGQHVDVSMLEAATLCLNGPYTAIAAQWHPELAPGRTIEVPSIEAAVDGAVGFCTMTAQQWADFCVLIGRPEWGDEPALRSADQRMVRIDELRAAIGAALGDRTVEEVVELGAALRVPVTPVGNGATVTGFDQVVARQVYRRGADGMRRPGPPYRLSATEPRPWGPAPALGSAAATWHAVRDPRPPEVSPGGRPFDGLRVVDLSAFWAGPFATLYLAAMGADVVKVESTAHPDGIRFLGGFAGEAPWERSMVFAGANAGKRDLTLDLEQAEGLELLWQLIAGAD
ncbi:MAG TPA: CoA transferase, partial [Acidimicrobiales bacterium]